MRYGRAFRYGVLAPRWALFRLGTLLRHSCTPSLRVAGFEDDDDEDENENEVSYDAPT